MKDITIKITGKRFVGDNVEEELEFVSDGMMFDKGGAKYYIYMRRVSFRGSRDARPVLS